jgi:hypothetical protein
MAYSQTNSKGQQYFLHMKDVTLKGGRLQRIYFFARDVRDGSVEGRESSNGFAGSQKGLVLRLFSKDLRTGGLFVVR